MATNTPTASTAAAAPRASRASSASGRGGCGPCRRVVRRAVAGAAGRLRPPSSMAATSSGAAFPIPCRHATELGHRRTAMPAQGQVTLVFAAFGARQRTQHVGGVPHGVGASVRVELRVSGGLATKVRPARERIGHRVTPSPAASAAAPAPRSAAWTSRCPRRSADPRRSARWSSQMVRTADHGAMVRRQLGQGVADQQPVQRRVDLVGRGLLGRAAGVQGFALRRNRALRRSSMTMLRATVNSQARAERSASPDTSGCCQARNNVSEPRPRPAPGHPVNRTA